MIASNLASTPNRNIARLARLAIPGDHRQVGASTCRHVVQGILDPLFRDQLKLYVTATDSIIELNDSNEFLWAVDHGLTIFPVRPGSTASNLAATLRAIAPAGTRSNLHPIAVDPAGFQPLPRTELFNLLAFGRDRINSILSDMPDGTEVTDPSHIAQAIAASVTSSVLDIILPLQSVDLQDLSSLGLIDSHFVVQTALNHSLPLLTQVIAHLAEADDGYVESVMASRDGRRLQTLLQATGLPFTTVRMLQCMIDAIVANEEAGPALEWSAHQLSAEYDGQELREAWHPLLALFLADTAAMHARAAADKTFVYVEPAKVMAFPAGTR